MRVLIVNTSERTGGAAVAANRLMSALNNNGVKAKMLVRDKETDNVNVVDLRCKWWQMWSFLWERWCIFWRLGFKRKHLFEIDIANIGTDITTLREFKEADVIHLHWVNQGFLSLSNIRKIIATGKRVVWTMHDFWPATAICHYPQDCTNYKDGACQSCRLLQGDSALSDSSSRSLSESSSCSSSRKASPTCLSARVWQRKADAYSCGNVTFVTCSRWLKEQVEDSLLLKNNVVTDIPNPIDTRVFCPHNKEEARRALGLPTDKRLILVVSQRVTDPRKGMSYMIDAVETLANEQAKVSERQTNIQRNLRENVGVVILGGHAEDFIDRMTLPVYPLGYVSDPRMIVSVYNAADVFVLPSLEDNLPNTIMEAMACGVPCVGFRVGGIPEMIDHRVNGYVAEYKNAADIAEGIRWVLQDADREELTRNALHKVHTTYSQQAVATKYVEVYNRR